MPKLSKWELFIIQDLTVLLIGAFLVLFTGLIHEAFVLVPLMAGLGFITYSAFDLFKRVFIVKENL
jgi:hypothetical protein